MVVQLKDGRRFVKLLKSGTRCDRFTLVLSNPAFAPLALLPCAADFVLPRTLAAD